MVGCARFCKRYSLKSRRITGSGKSLPTNAADIIWDYIIDANDLIIEKGLKNKLKLLSRFF